MGIEDNKDTGFNDDFDFDFDIDGIDLGIDSVDFGEVEETKEEPVDDGFFDFEEETEVQRVDEVEDKAELTEEFEEVQEVEDVAETKQLKSTLDMILDSVDEETAQAILMAKQYGEYDKPHVGQSKSESLVEYNKKNGGDSKQKVSLGMPTKTNPLVVEKTGKPGNYIVGLDFHFWHKNISARKDYVSECHEIADLFKTCILVDETINNAILPGDVFHQGFPDLDSSGWYSTWLEEVKEILNSRGGELYAVIGNHEYTYSKNNLFWHKVDTCIKTPELIIDNGVKICLDSHPSRKATRDWKEKIEGDICISHSEVIPPQVASTVQREDGVKLFVSKHNGDFERFKVKLLLLAHTHMLDNRFKVVDDETGFEMNVEYMASSGRTNVNEIRDDFLERHFRVLRVNSDKTFNVDYIPFMLRNVEDTLVKEEVLLNKKVSQKRKEYKEAKLKVCFDTPIEQLKKEYNNPDVNDLIDSASRNEKNINVGNILSRMEELLMKW